ncbi:hypothetical protein [Sinorhizobium meliloti]|uniref:hypothetical protein n=1 Tax=Rhizobium meliloti TaxID=382 RepID=UPI0012A9B699|nr:hypothetical protein [Sinorhizobium meliloti]QGJ74094.1 hypothetical protein C3L21_08750 [Sinorhizobium meliloti]
MIHPILGQLMTSLPVRLDMFICRCVSETINFFASGLSRFNAGHDDCFTISVGGRASIEMPKGYETILTYYERTNPEAFSLLYDPEEDLKEEEKWIASRARDLGLPVVTIGNSEAYPVDLIRTRLG